MKYLTQIFLFFIVVNCCIAQQTLVGKVMDSETKEALAFVNIGIVGTSLGTVSNENGEFVLKTKSEENVLEFSYLGYLSQTVSSSEAQSDLQILLEPNSQMIDEVQILSSNFNEEVTLGARNKNGRSKSVAFGNAQLGAEIGTLIRIKKETFVKSVSFVLNHANGDSILMRINMYDYSDKRIGKKVLQHNIYVREKQRRGTYTINLEEYDIILKNDILLSLEWLKDSDKGGNQNITFDTKRSRKMKGIFARSSQTMAFRKLPLITRRKPCIYLVGKQSSK